MSQNSLLFCDFPKLFSCMAEAAAAVELTYRQELQLQEKVMVAELQQGDSYTKRARPSWTVVWGS